MMEATLYNNMTDNLSSPPPPPPPTAIIEPFLEPLDTAGNYILPTTQYIANAAILVVFAYLIPLIVMEVNYFRYAVWRSHGRLVRNKVVAAVGVAEEEEGDGGVEGEGVKAKGVVEKKKKKESSSSGRSTSRLDDEENQRTIVMQNLTSSVSSDDMSAVVAADEEKKNNDDDNNDDEKQSQSKKDNNNNNHNTLQDTSRHSAVGHLMHDVRSMSVTRSTVVPDVITRRNNSRRRSSTSNSKHDNKNNQTTTTDQQQQQQQQQLLLHNAYKCIQTSSLISIISSLLIYTISATLIAMYTRNMEPKMVAVVTGSSKFVAAVIVFILSAKVPQWVSIIICCYRLLWCLDLVHFLLTNIA